MIQFIIEALHEITDSAELMCKIAASAKLMRELIIESLNQSLHH